MKIAFALTAHTPEDERVVFQQAAALNSAGINTSIIYSETRATFEAIDFLTLELNKLKPDIIICDTPVAIWAALRHRRLSKKHHNHQQRPRIVYDITEWYPSKKNLRRLSPLKKLFKFLILTAVSLYSSLFVSAFIFGEYYKAKPFHFLFFWKKYIYLPYYANVSELISYPIKNLQKECRLFYAGSLTEEKGFYNVLKVANECAQQMPNTKFALQIISSDSFPHISCPTSHSPQLTLIIIPKLPFKEFITEIGKADIFFDLRKIDFENSRCLPIKLFYYIATARPVIYSKLKAICKEVPDIQNFGTLINPKDTKAAVEIIENYVNNYELYQSHCKNARKAAEQKYNWIFYEKNFVDFISTM